VWALFKYRPAKLVCLRKRETAFLCRALVLYLIFILKRLEKRPSKTEKTFHKTKSEERTTAKRSLTTSNMATQTMQALHYDGPFKVSVKEIQRPKIEHPDDVIIKVTTAAICGSDLQ